MNAPTNRRVVPAERPRRILAAARLVEAGRENALDASRRASEEARRDTLLIQVAG